MVDHDTDMTGGAPPPLFRLFTEINIIAQLSSNFAQRVLPSGLSLAQFSILNHFVRLGGPRSPAELANSFQVTKGAMTQLLQKLAAAGLVDVTPDPHDGRAKRVMITEAGRAMQARCVEALTVKLGPIAAHVHAEDIDAALPFLERMRKLLDEGAR